MIARAFRGEKARAQTTTYDVYHLHDLRVFSPHAKYRADSRELSCDAAFASSYARMLR